VRLLLGLAQTRPVRTGAAADRVDAVEPLEDPSAQSAKGFAGFGLVETRTLLDSR
jgi:hypothetical protein